MIFCIRGSPIAWRETFKYSSSVGVSCSQTIVQNGSPLTSVMTLGGEVKPDSFMIGAICLNRFTNSPTFPGLQCMISRTTNMRASFDVAMGARRASAQRHDQQHAAENSRGHERPADPLQVTRRRRRQHEEQADTAE